MPRGSGGGGYSPSDRGGGHKASTGLNGAQTLIDVEIDVALFAFELFDLVAESLVERGDEMVTAVDTVEVPLDSGQLNVGEGGVLFPV